MRVVVTGATGNVGTALLQRLTARPDVTVVGLARRLPDDAHPEVEWHSADLAEVHSAGPLEAAMRGADAVVHLAWGFQPSHRPDYLEQLAVGGTRRVVEAAASTGVPYLVHMSSVGAYSPRRSDLPVDESWPTGGIPTSLYSRHKSAAERILDEHEVTRRRPAVARLRPGIIGQARAASSLLRYGVPGLVPAPLLGALPVLPLDRRLVIPMVHASDVALAVEQALISSAPGPFNLTAPPPLTAKDIASALGARHVHVPARLLRLAAATTWRTHLQQVDPGWLDLAMREPLLKTDRAEAELGWSPTVTADAALREVVDGVTAARAGQTPVLRARTTTRALRDLVSKGPVSRRRRT